MKADLGAAVPTLCRYAGLPEPVRELRFAPPRLWRFDAAWPDQKLAVEIHGSTWAGGRHTRGSGFEKDREKMNEAVLLGWRVLEFTRRQVDDGTMIEVLRRALG